MAAFVVSVLVVRAIFGAIELERRWSKPAYFIDAFNVRRSGGGSRYLRRLDRKRSPRTVVIRPSVCLSSTYSSHDADTGIVEIVLISRAVSGSD